MNLVKTESSGKMLETDLQIFQKIVYESEKEGKASCFSHLFFNWIGPLINLGSKRILQKSDLYDIPLKQKFSPLLSEYHNYKSLESKPFFLTKILQTISKKELYLSLFLMSISTILNFASPICLNQILNYLSDDNAEIYIGYVWASVMLFCAFARSLFQQHAFYYMGNFALKSQNLLYARIYEKTMRISSAAKKYQDSGKIMNLINIDINAIHLFLSMLAFAIAGPIVLIIATIYIIIEVSWVGVIGIMILVLALYFQGALQFFGYKFRKNMLKFTDQRSKAITEYINGIKIIKYYGWENMVLNNITKIRKNETATIFKQGVVRGGVEFISTFFPLMISVVVFGIYSSLFDDFTTSKAYTVLTLFNMLQMPLRILGFMVMNYTNYKAGIKRIEHYLHSEEKSKINTQDKTLPKGTIIMENASFAWETQDSIDHNNKEKVLLEKKNNKRLLIKQPSSTILLEKSEPRNFTIISEINFHGEKGKYIAVVGQVGMGKSSFAHALLSEMTLLTGSIKSHGKIAFVPQTAWLMNSSLKDNILFYNEFNEEKYNKILNLCELGSDLDQLPGKDLTEIGERGINLSGGQKQRVSLARALYEDADIYVIDDVLSALDAHVGKNVYENVIRGLLKNKLVIFITHALHYVKDADEILVFKNGKIIERGNFKDLSTRVKSEFNELNVQFEKNHKNEEEETPDKKTKEKDYEYVNKLGEQDKLKLGALLKTEERAEGSVPWRIYKFYISAGGFFTTLATILFLVLAQGFRILNDWWLGIWASNQFDLEIGESVGIYIGLAVIGSLLVFFRACVFSKFCLNTAISMQYSLMVTLMKSPMSWFDITPSGRILGRTSKDQDNVDTQLQMTLQFCMVNILMIAGAIIIASTVTPLFLALIGIELIYFIYLIRKFLKSSREIKRIELNSRAPLNSHFSETSNGLYVLRSSHKENIFFERFVEKGDEFARSVKNNLYTYVWIALRTDIFGASLIGAAAYFGALSKSFNYVENPALIGLSITWLLQISQMLTFVIKLLGDSENHMNSVERINSYIENNPSERNLDFVVKKKSQNWPTKGEISAHNLKYKYREGLDYVIHGISFEIKSGEKIGVVGRTGSGKSTLTLGFLRILEIANEPEGKIIIDGKIIGELELNNLRSNITMIPQDPVLFSGSLKNNIDPFNEYPNEKIIEALKKVQIWESLKLLEENEDKILDYEIFDGGSSFSLGQKQLLCICRALVRQSKILLMDEATASIDEKTDQIIQNMIRNEFKDTTVITIAHRLNTIIQYDRIMVLEKGKLIEYDTPIKLIEKGDTLLAQLIKENGKEFEDKMIFMARNPDKIQNYQNIEHSLDLIEIPSENFKNGEKERINKLAKKRSKLELDFKHETDYKEDEKISVSIYDELEEKELFPLKF